MQETPSQLRGIGMYGLRCDSKIYFTLTFNTVKKDNLS